MGIAIIRDGRIGIQKMGTDETDHILYEAVPEDGLDQYYQEGYDDKKYGRQKGLFVYPLGKHNFTSCSYKSWLKNEHLPTDVGKGFPEYCVLTISEEGQIRHAVFNVKEKEEKGVSCEYWYMDVNTKLKKGMVFCNFNGREFLVGMLIAGASEEKINEQVVIAKIGTCKDFLWFNIEDIVQEVKRLNAST